MTVSDRKSFLNYLNELADEYYITYHSSIGKKIIDPDYSFLAKELNPVIKLLNI